MNVKILKYLCVIESSTSKEFVEIVFPIFYILITTSHDESLQMLLEGNCNVIANDRSILFDLLSGIED